MRALRMALQLLTRLPLTAPAAATPQERGRSVLYYPLVGLILGTGLLILNNLLGQGDARVHATVLLVGWTLLTGGLRIDGLVHSTDAGLGGYGDGQRGLNIPQDTAGVMRVTLVLLVKFAALSTLRTKDNRLVSLIAPLLGRAAMVSILLASPYARSQGHGAKYTQPLPRRAAKYVRVVCVIAVVSIDTGRGVVVLAVNIVGVALLRRMMLHRLGGAALGASCEITEALVLITACFVEGT